MSYINMCILWFCFGLTLTSALFFLPYELRSQLDLLYKTDSGVLTYSTLNLYASLGDFAIIIKSNLPTNVFHLTRSS